MINKFLNKINFSQNKLQYFVYSMGFVYATVIHKSFYDMIVKNQELQNKQLIK